MNREDLISEIRKIEIASRNNSRFSLSGSYRSALKGYGMEISGFKEYSADDDYRAVDWNVSARTGKVYSRIYREERENPVFFIMDTSYSMYTGGSFSNKRKTKIETAAVVMALIAFSAVFNSDKAGSVFCSDSVEDEFRIDGKSSHIADMVFSLLEHSPKNPFFNISYALSCIPRSIKKGCCFIISDFKSTLPEGLIHSAGSKTDLVFIRITDPSDSFRESSFSFYAADSFQPSGSSGNLLRGSSYFRLTGRKSELLKNKAQSFLNEQKKLILREGISLLDINTEDNLPSALSSFFSSRKV